MNAHDDLAQLFRQVGSVGDSYREFDQPELPTGAPDAPASCDAPLAATSANEAASLARLIDAPRPLPGRGEVYARIATARYGLPDGSLG